MYINIVTCIDFVLSPLALVLNCMKQCSTVWTMVVTIVPIDNWLVWDKSPKNKKKLYFTLWNLYKYNYLPEAVKLNGSLYMDTSKILLLNFWPPVAQPPSIKFDTKFNKFNVI